MIEIDFSYLYLSIHYFSLKIIIHLTKKSAMIVFDIRNTKVILYRYTVIDFNKCMIITVMTA